jgi:hypothetical protein
MRAPQSCATEFQPAARVQSGDHEFVLARTKKMTMKSLQEAINIELKKLCAEGQAFVWLTSPQEVLGLRIPARMIATGEGRACWTR